MDKKTQQILLFAGVGIIAYMWWKRNQDNGTSNASGWERTGYGKTPKQSCANQRCNCQTASGGQAEVTCQGNYPDCHC